MIGPRELIRSSKLLFALHWCIMLVIHLLAITMSILLGCSSLFDNLLRNLVVIDMNSSLSDEMKLLILQWPHLD